MCVTADRKFAAPFAAGAGSVTLQPMTGYVYAGLTGLFFGLQGPYGEVLGRRVSPVLVTSGLLAFALPYLLVFLPDKSFFRKWFRDSRIRKINVWPRDILRG